MARTENAARKATMDPLAEYEYVCEASLGTLPGRGDKGPSGSPYIHLTSSFEDLYITPQESLWESAYPAHVMVPVGSTRLLEPMLARAGGVVTVQSKKYATTKVF